MKRVVWLFVPVAVVGPDLSQLGSLTDLDPGTITEPELTAWLSVDGVPYRRTTTRGFDVIVPGRSVSPTAVAG